MLPRQWRDAGVPADSLWVRAATRPTWCRARSGPDRRRPGTGRHGSRSGWPRRRPPRSRWPAAPGPRSPTRRPRRPWERALSWFLSLVPAARRAGGPVHRRGRRGAGARLGHRVAAVSAAAGEIYVNPLRTMPPSSGGSCWRTRCCTPRCGTATGSARATRTCGTWPCDYVINGWLVEMGVGEMPDGLLYDPELAGLSAEQVYDRIARDLRRLRKLGHAAGHRPGRRARRAAAVGGSPGGGVDLDDYYRRALLDRVRLPPAGRARAAAGRAGGGDPGARPAAAALGRPAGPLVRRARAGTGAASAPTPARPAARRARRTSPAPAGGGRRSWPAGARSGWCWTPPAR